MKAVNLKTLLLSVLLTSTVGLQAASLPLSIDGEYMLRLPGSSRYMKNTFQSIPDNVIICIPDVNTASSTSAILDGHKVKLYPGVTFKISKGAFIPLTGRFEFSADNTATNSICIVAHNCNAGYYGGHFLIEATPDNGVFFALKDNNGSAWIKDVSRNVFELKSGQQLHVPMFGNAVLKPRLESFWGKDPSSFKDLGEVGQEIAYGIVGTSAISNDKKAKNDDSKKDLEKTSDEDANESIDDEDYLDPEEEAWLNSGEDQEESLVSESSGVKSEEEPETSPATPEE